MCAACLEMFQAALTLYLKTINFISKLLHLENCRCVCLFQRYKVRINSMQRAACSINPAVESNEWYQTELNARYGTAMMPRRATRINQTSPCWVSQLLIRQAKGSRSSYNIHKAFQKILNEPL